MKKILTAVLSVALIFTCFAVSAFTASAEDEPDAYLWLKGVYNSAEDNIQPSITFIIDASTFTGTEYTVFCNARFDEGSSGTVYVNQYSYSDYDAAVDSDWTYLLNFKDFALCGEATLGQWQSFSFTWNPSQNDRSVAGEGCAAITMGIGFYLATGGIAVSEFGIKDADDNVVWSYNFEDGLDVANEMIARYDFPGDEDVNWGLVGAEITDGSIIETSEDPVESSAEISVETSVETSEETSEDDTPETGDTGIIALAIISVISLAGAVIVKRK
ncbi:MAG: hypothetical protein PHW77_07690 [Eubacteriales bacterium]|nr:hypothetical protein [Eubacteriales bacterium]